MSSQTPPQHTLKISGHRLRYYAGLILRYNPLHQQQISPLKTDAIPVRIVCISDTHNLKPEIPPGDILIHAGDLTDHGSFAETQTCLDWLASQPHAYKIYVPGNHDVLLDENFLARHPERRDGSSKTLHDLTWPDNIIYLNDRAITIEITKSTTDSDNAVSQPKIEDQEPRKLKVYGSPYSTHHIPAAFQYAPTDHLFWENKIPNDADIIITHGPPRLHLDEYLGIPRGCALLGEEIIKVQPRLHVFGHVHNGYGREDVVFDTVRKTYEATLNASYDDRRMAFDRVWVLASMAASTLWCWLLVACLGKKGVEKRAKITTMVNASMVAWDVTKKEKVLKNDAIVVEI